MTARVDWSRADWVLLDMDGTLLDLAFDNYFWRELLPAAYAHRHGMEPDAAHRALAPAFARERGSLNWYCLDWWSAHTGVDLLALKRSAADRIRALPGSRSFLQSVRGSGRRLWLATNAHGASLTLKMERTGLTGEFDALICAHDFGVPKEQPAFWPALQERYPFDPLRTLFVDDSPAVLRAARSYGIAQVVAISRPNSSLPPRMVEEFPSVTGLTELLPISV